MADKLMSIRVKEDELREFSELCDELGLTVSGAIRIYMRYVLNYRKIPFLVSVPLKNDKGVR